MKILVEAMCANFGGIRTYAEHLLRAWPVHFPEDDVHVLLRSDSDLVLDPRLVRHQVEVRRPAVVTRPAAQTLAMPRIARAHGVDAVLATSASTTLRRPGPPMAVVHYDLRHELRPDQFTRRTRALRAISYRHSYRLADGILSISQRSLDDLHERHPATRQLPGRVVHLGADHVDGWTNDAATGSAVTFAHHTNKNLDLSLDGWQHVVRSLPDAHLTVLGLGSTRRAQMASRVAELHLQDNVTLAPFVPEDEFRRIFAGAGLVLFPSDFEGFGLPVVEGMRLGIPVVIGPERATQEVANGHATVMDGWTPEALARAVVEATQRTPSQRAAALSHARGFTWGRTVVETRGFLEHLSARG